jgi:hypothetical protein
MLTQFGGLQVVVPTLPHDRIGPGLNLARQSFIRHRLGGPEGLGDNQEADEGRGSSQAPGQDGPCPPPNSSRPAAVRLEILTGIVCRGWRG